MRRSLKEGTCIKQKELYKVLQVSLNAIQVTMSQMGGVSPYL